MRNKQITLQSKLYNKEKRTNCVKKIGRPHYLVKGRICRPHGESHPCGTARVPQLTGETIYFSYIILVGAGVAHKMGGKIESINLSWDQANRLKLNQTSLLTLCLQPQLQLFCANLPKLLIIAAHCSTGNSVYGGACILTFQIPFKCYLASSK